MDQIIKEKIKFWSAIILYIIVTATSIGYTIWHLSYSWNHPELTSMQVFKHILNTLF